ncbi:hypothetical protein ANCDUO_19565, partial [Ancylostoma duodenale]
CMLNTVQHRHVAIARLSHPTNLGRTMQDLRFIIIVIAPSRALFLEIMERLDLVQYKFTNDELH